MTDKRKVVRAYQQVRSSADRVLDKSELIPIRRIYERETNGIARTLSRSAKARSRSEAMPHLGNLVTVAKQQVGTLGWKVGDQLARTSRLVYTEGYRSIANVVGSIYGGSPLDEEARLSKLLSRRTLELDRLRQDSSDGMVLDMQGSIARKMKLAAIEEDATVGDLIETAESVVEAEAWRLERLVRTETSFAFNQAAFDALNELSGDPDFKGMYGRWTEMINDITGRPFDNKVAKDSIALHGQLARPGKEFRMPPSADVGKYRDLAWLHPPNRCNDRAILVPWSRDFGIPGYILQGGRRVPFGGG